ncbi:MAG TPA: glycosyltransferase [Candidatus Limiplasma sp.]|nr:glycosyltransferase [Candidatus Limiplasma sp.]HPS80901.1 glycosyltransferase [Candidatus Limiplasma sp.]
MPPLVSICCVTYNHAATIAGALESFLAQRADVPIEILVHDDASTDGTEAILRRYAAQYPDTVFPLFETENQYRKGTAMDATFNFPRARGEYIALCEGDDEWTDPHKLQKQIECIKAHPGATFCFTNGTVRDMSGAAPDRAFVPYYPEEAAYYIPRTRTLNLEEIARLTFIPTASFLFPRSALESIPREWLLSPCPNGDLRLKLLLTGAGEAVYLHAFTCLYRLNAASSAMAGWGAEAAQKTRLRCEQTLRMLQSVDCFTQGRWRAALQTLADAQYRVLWEAAPSFGLLRQPEARRAFGKLPLARRLKCLLKAALPESAFYKVKRLLRRA